MGWIRKHRTAVALGVAVVALVLLIGRFVQQYQDAGPDPAAGAAEPSTSAAPFDPSSVTGSSAKNFFPKRGATLPRTTLSPAGPKGFTIGHAAQHTLVLTVTSAGPIPRVGYIVPTSSKSSYGDVKNAGRHWSLTTTVVGRPYYAALFVQAGATGTPITCRVSVDGATTDTKTTSGAYGRVVCLG
jgi:hypothetical protein